MLSVRLGVNFSEDGKSRSGWHILRGESVFGLSTLEEGFEHIELWGVVALLKSLKLAVLVVVDAARPVHARVGQVKRPALLLLVAAFVHTLCRLTELVLPVGELALFVVPAEASLTPVFAHFSLKSICLISFFGDVQEFFDHL